jgi:hypothetical protein
VPENKACFLEDTHFWSTDEEYTITKTAVQALERGTILRFQKDVCATVSSVIKHAVNSRNLVTIYFGEGGVLNQYSLTVTCDHAILIRRDNRNAIARAQDVQQSDFVRTQNGFAEVREVFQYKRDEAVFEVAFSHPDERALISTQDSPLAVQVFGEVPLRPCVKLLVFKRYDGFGELFLQSNELAPCRHALAEENLSMDLYDLGLGPGKLVTKDRQIAREVVDFLRAKHTIIDGKIFVPIRIIVLESGKLEVSEEQTTLDNRCVIVTADMEKAVRALVKSNEATTNMNLVVNEPGAVLDLDISGTLHEPAPKRLRVSAGGLISKPPAPRSDGGVTNSTTDGKRPPHGTRCATTTNPRRFP